MQRRANGAGTLYKRGTVYYTKIKVGGKWVCQSTGTGDKEKARKILDGLAKGHELTDEQRLAAIEVALRRSGPSPDFDTAWQRYVDAPANVAQTDGAQTTDAGRWRFFTRWLHGYDGGPRCRINCEAAHPEVKTLAAVTPEIAAEFVRNAQGVSAPGTVNKYVRTFKRVWRLNGEDRTPWDSFRKLREHPHLRRALSDKEVSRLIEKAGGELRVLFAVGAYTGLRLGDAACVRWEDFDKDGRTLTLRPSKTKNSSGRTVAIPAHPALTRIVGKRKRTGYVMPELAALPEWALSDRVTAHFQACGFEGGERPDGYRKSVPVVGFHSLRSTFITNMANIGAPMAMVQAIVGHMSPEMSMHYYRANAEAARARIAALPDYSK